MSCNCPKKNESAEYGRPAPTQVKAAEISDEPKDINRLMKDLKGYLTTDEAKKTYFKAIVDQGFV